MSRWTKEDLAALQARQVSAAAPTKRSKYGSQRTTAAGHVFDSKKEAGRYQELLFMQKAGEIQKLERQPPYELHTLTPTGEWVVVSRFTPDFRYERDGVVVVEDVKSVATKTKESYRMRKRHWEAQYGQTLVEV